ncbi:MAG: hypothetical protein K2W33_15030 [Burkholderiales bacterium]|nr:hypothetical protein [Burkholderiales bacterium]
MKQLPESETLLPVRVSLAFGPLLDHLHEQVVSQRIQPPGDLDIHVQRGPLSGYGSSVRLGSGPTAEIAQKRAECLLYFGDQAAVAADVALPVLVPVVAAQFASSLHGEIDPGTPGAMAEVALRNSIETNPAICHSHDFCDANVVMAKVVQNLTGVDPADEGVLANSKIQDLWNQAWSLAKASFMGDLPAAYDVCATVSQTGQLPEQWQTSRADAENAQPEHFPNTDSPS